MIRTLVLGGPGAGKTERLLAVFEAALDRGVAPDRIAFVTFTRGAAKEALDRACAKFRLSPPDLPHVRTLHSLAFRALGLKRSDVLGEEHLKELADATGEMLEGSSDPDAPATRMNAHSLITVDGYARATLKPLEEAWRDHGGNLDWYRLLRFSKALAIYKEERGLLDFSDMLSEYAKLGAPLPIEVAIVDEAQDLTMLQWSVVDHAFSGAKELWVGGDDDQSVHRWAGAAEDHLMALDWPREIIPLSHRLPRAIFTFAGEILGRLSRRFEKPSEAAPRDGSVSWLAAPGNADLRKGDWLLLGRTRHQLSSLAAVARDQGVFYRLKGASSVKVEDARAIRAWETLRAGRTVEAADAAAAIRASGRTIAELSEDRPWSRKDFPGVDFGPIWHDALSKIALEDRSYILSALRRGEKLAEEPRVRIETMHGSKGAQAENVLMLTDMSPRVWRGYELDPDSEHRVFYVGATRASERLFPVAPQTAWGYPL